MHGSRISAVLLSSRARQSIPVYDCFVNADGVLIKRILIIVLNGCNGACNVEEEGALISNIRNIGHSRCLPASPCCGRPASCLSALLHRRPADQPTALLLRRYTQSRRSPPSAPRRQFAPITLRTMQLLALLRHTAIDSNRRTCIPTLQYTS
jgi:hypothetical protein